MGPINFPPFIFPIEDFKACVSCRLYLSLHVQLVNNQLTGFLDVHSILSGMQSGFRSGYGCVTATLKGPQ